MSNGLRVWDALGQVVLDLTDRSAAFVAAYSAEIPANSLFTTIQAPGVSPSTHAAFCSEEYAYATVMQNLIEVRPWSDTAYSYTLPTSVTLLRL